MDVTNEPNVASDHQSNASVDANRVTAPAMGNTTDPQSSGLLPLFRILAATIAAVLAAYTTLLSVNPTAIHWDYAVGLEIANMLIEGNDLYGTVAETNPPLWYWLMLPAAAVDRLLGFRHELSYIICVFLLSLWSSWISARLLAPFFRLRESRLLFFAATLCVFVIFPPHLESIRGQKDVLMLIFSLPFLSLAVSRVEKINVSHRVAFLVGIAAGFGLCLKPHFFIFWVAVEVTLIFLTREWRVLFRPENAGVVLAGLVYFVAVLWFEPEYFALVPSLANYYGGFDEPKRIFTAETLLVAFAVVGFFVIAPKGGRRIISILFLVAAVALNLQAYLQAGWPYHFAPSYMLASLALLTMVIATLEERFQFKIAVGRLPLMLMSLLMLCLLAYSGTRVSAQIAMSNEPAVGMNYWRLYFSHTIERYCHNKRFVALSTSVGGGFPTVYMAGSRWGLRFLHLWPIPALYGDVDPLADPFPYHSMEEMPPFEKKLVYGVTEDIVTGKPDVILIDQCPWMQALGWTSFNHLDYLGQYPPFRRAFSEYRLVKSFDCFHFYQRSPRLEDG